MEHTYHPSIHEHGLADNCERCAEHAEQPWFTLDDENMGNLVRRTKRWRDGDMSCRPRSDNEAKAMRQIDRHLTIMHRVEKYL